MDYLRIITISIFYSFGVALLLRLFCKVRQKEFEANQKAYFLLFLFSYILGGILNIIHLFIFITAVTKILYIFTLTFFMMGPISLAFSFVKLYSPDFSPKSQYHFYLLVFSILWVLNYLLSFFYIKISLRTNWRPIWSFEFAMLFLGISVICL